MTWPQPRSGGSPSQRQVSVNTNSRAAGANPTTARCPARDLLALRANEPNGRQSVPNGNNFDHGACGAAFYETRSKSRALCLLGGTARETPSAGARRDRAGRHSRRAERCLHPCARPQPRATQSGSPEPGCARCSAANSKANRSSICGTTSQPNQSSRACCAILADECIGTVAGATAANRSGEAIELELLLLPLGTRAAEFRPCHRRAGTAEIPPWLGDSPLGPLTARQPPPRRRGARKAAAAALHGAARPARLRGL